MSPSEEVGWPQKSLGTMILFVPWNEPDDLKKSLKILLFVIKQELSKVCIHIYLA